MVEAKDGMVIETNNARVQEARKTMYELLLSNHDKKCLTCARNQDCEFQALGRELGVEDSPYEGERDLKPIDVSESITRDPNKCILCRRCVSVCKNIQTTSILTAENRGFQTVITPAFGLPMGNTACTFCGQCVIVCPVGALRETWAPPPPSGSPWASASACPPAPVRPASWPLPSIAWALTTCSTPTGALTSPSWRRGPSSWSGSVP